MPPTTSVDSYTVLPKNRNGLLSSTAGQYGGSACGSALVHRTANLIFHLIVRGISSYMSTGNRPCVFRTSSHASMTVKCCASSLIISATTPVGVYIRPLAAVVGFGLNARMRCANRSAVFAHAWAMIHAPRTMNRRPHAAHLYCWFPFGYACTCPFSSVFPQ